MNPTAILLPLFWLGGWIAASIWFRRANGKPIMPQKPTNAAFCEDWCSGRSLRNGLTRVGGARNCLLVYVANGQLVVSPRFPFTLMFLPEIFDLDIRASTAEIACVEPRRQFWGSALRISFNSGDLAPIELRLDDERGFIDSLGSHVQVAGERTITSPEKPRRKYRLTFFRVFMGVWGAAALTAALSELPDDFRYRREGIETVGVFDGHTGVVGERNDQGVLTYSVNGRRYHLTSLQGNGIYKLGSEARLYYLPDRPEEAREAAYLAFDLLWLFLGLVAVTLAIFSGRIAKRFSR